MYAESPPIWDNCDYGVVYGKPNGYQENFVIQSAGNGAGNEPGAQAKKAREAVREALVNASASIEEQDERGTPWKISAHVLPHENAPPEILFQDDCYQQGQGEQDEGMHIVLQMYSFAKGQGSNTLMPTRTMKSGHFYGPPGVGPPLKVGTGGCGPSSEVESEFMLRMLLVNGFGHVFKQFVDMFKVALRGECSAVGGSSSSACDLFHGRVQPGANACDEDNGGYDALGRELYDGSCVLPPKRAYNLLMFMQGPSPTLFGIAKHGLRIDYATNLARAVTQRTSPLGANPGVIAGSKLHKLIKNGICAADSTDGDESDDEELNPEVIPEGLKLVSILLTNNDEVQWYACWILLRMAKEAQRRESIESQQKPNRGYETDIDFISFRRRVYNVLSQSKEKLQQIANSEDGDHQQQKFPLQNQWRKHNLARAVLNVHAQLSSQLSSPALAPGSAPGSALAPAPGSAPAHAETVEAQGQAHYYTMPDAFFEPEANYTCSEDTPEYRTAPAIQPQPAFAYPSCASDSDMPTQKRMRGVSDMPSGGSQ